MGEKLVSLLEIWEGSLVLDRKMLCVSTEFCLGVQLFETSPICKRIHLGGFRPICKNPFGRIFKPVTTNGTLPM